MDAETYSRDELEVIGDDEFPKRGKFCHKCQTFIPAFADLTDGDELHIRGLASLDRQIVEIQRITGCSHRWAKIWANHPDGPQPKRSVTSVLCPKCKAPLRSDQAKQCFECGTD